MKIVIEGHFKPRTRDVDAIGLVKVALERAIPYDAGNLQSVQAQVEKLAEIVGSLLERLPETDWLDIVCIYGVCAE